MMNKNRQINLYRILIIGIFFLWLIIIFYLSAMNGEKSNNKSKEIISKDLAVGTRIVSKIYNQSKNSTNENQQEKITEINAIFRKCMHGLVFFALSIIILAMLKTFGIKGKKVYIIAVLGAFLYACTDEFHQSFVSGRTSSFTDVLIDTAGATIGVGIWILFEKVLKVINKQS